MIAGMTYYELCWYFLIYSFVGWGVEVCYQAVTKAKIVNRGFLNGPICPIYGLGAVSMLMLLSGLGFGRAEDIPPLLLFPLGTAITTAIELAAGWVLDKLFGARWWDYSEKPFNFHGYICLEFSLIWGFSVTFAARVIHPFVEHTSADLIPPRYGWPILAVLYLAYLADLIVTVAVLRGLNRKLSELDAIRSQMRVLSDRMSTQLGENALETVQRLQGARVQTSLGRAELREQLEQRQKDTARQLQELRARAEALSESLYASRHFGAGRLLAAFPSMKHKRHHETVEALRARLAQSREKKRRGR